MPKKIQFEGSTHVFPDDFTDSDISSALDGLHPRVPGMEKLGGVNPPGIPQVKPAGLMSDAEKSSQGNHYTKDPVTGIAYKSGAMTNPIMDYANSAGRKIKQGVEQISGAGIRTPHDTTESTGSRVAGGVSKVVRGAGQAAAPLAAGALAAAPVATATGMAVGGLAQQGTEKALRSAGVQPGYSDLAGDVVGLSTGIGASKGAAAVPGRALGKVAAGAARGAVEHTPILGPLVKGAIKGGREAYEGIKSQRVADAEAALLDKYSQEPPDWMESPPKPPSMFERYGDPKKAGVPPPEAPVAPQAERPLPAWASMEPPKMESAPAVEPVPATESIGSGRKPGNTAHGEEVARKHAEAEAARAAAEPSPESWFVDSPPPKPPAYPESVGPPVALGPPLAPPVEPKVTPPLPPPPPKAGLADPGAPKVQAPPEPPAIRPPDRSNVPPISAERVPPSIPVPPPEVTTAPPAPVTVKSGPPAPLQIGRSVPKVQEPPRAPVDAVPETTVTGTSAVPAAAVPAPVPDMPVPPAGASEAPVPPARELPSGHRAVHEGDAVLEGVHPDYAELPSPRKAQAKDLRVAEGLAKQGVTVDKLARALDEGDWAKINRWVKSVHPEHRAYDPLKPGSDPAALEARVQKLVNTYRRMPAVAAEAPVVEPVVDAPPPVVEEAPAVTVPKAGRKIGSGKRKKAATSAE